MKGEIIHREKTICVSGCNNVYFGCEALTWDWGMRNSGTAGWLLYM